VTLLDLAEVSRDDLGLDGVVLLDPDGRILTHAPVALDPDALEGEVIAGGAHAMFVSDGDVWLAVAEPVDLGTRRFGWIVASDRIDEDLQDEVGLLTGTGTMLLVDGVVRMESLGGLPWPRVLDRSSEAVTRVDDLLVTAVPFGARAEILLVRELAGVWTPFLGAALPILGVGAGSLVLAAVLAAFVARSVTTPLRQLTQVAQGIAAGGKAAAIAGTRTSSAISGEAEQLRATFVHMLEQLESSRRTIEERNEWLQASLVANEEARHRAVAADRAKSTFLANMSHELRTPLNAIIGYAELLQEDATDATADDLARIQSSALHLLGLIDGVLDLTKVEAGRMEVHRELFWLADLVRDVAATAMPLVARQGNRLVVEQPELSEPVFADRTKLKQILLNLLSNAAKFTRGGEITLRLSRTEGLAGAPIIAEVQDTGIGIDEAQLGEIFQPFRQGDPSTTRQYGGTGLGLAISQQFAELMGGTLTVRSDPGQGSVFTATLPGSGERVPARSAARRSPLVLFGGDGSLVADGFLVVQVPASEVSTVARRLRPDAIVLEVVAESGWGVLCGLRSNPDLVPVPILVLSRSDERARALALGATEHVCRGDGRDWAGVLASVGGSTWLPAE
jgi:signal transduction histidine kinase